ncbi:DNA polymerase [Rhodocaloribacter litoris]|uniref:DNA polymerase domain-containing protein n=1 Tax=Rhodocaloribacter litoris TaxID=2558931 RepID=UPI00141E76A2|nr:DNA polymerase domain-containing protein [Rhodocaloribacter litoris]QXD14627.1 DNA polymerase [Rhodocaloribacter litoris]
MSHPLPASGSPTDIALFGKDATPRIVDVQPLLDGDAARVRVYRRSPDGRHIETETAPFFPFFFLSDITLLNGFPRERFRFQRLAGDNFFRFLVVFSSWTAYWDAVRHVERRTERRESRPEALYLVGNPAQQYLMQTGRTCFKEMTFDDLHRLQLDIEVYTEHGFPLAERPGDAVVIVALSDNRGWRRLLHRAPGVTVAHGEAFETEAALLGRLIELVRERDPDVIEGHNVYAFDLAYLQARCQRHGLALTLGRDGSTPRVFPSSMRFAERTVDFPAFEIPGRHIVDTYFQVMSYDVFKRDLPGYGLKAAARYFGFAAKERTYVEGPELARAWREDPARLLAYALDDVTETERLARHLSGSTFYLTQMLPMPYGQVARTGPAAKIEALFVREYLRRRHSLPKSQWGSQTAGGYTDVFITGVTGPIVYADVESLYPSIMLQYDVRPRSDALGLFPELLRRLTELRLEAKHRMKTAPSEELRSELDARQTSYKNIINSFYGHLGFSLALFNDFAEADRVATTGQQLLRRIIGLIRKAGGRVVEVDTDGVLFVPPPGVAGEAAERAFVRQLNEAMPPGIRIGFDGRFKKMLSYKKKNYALLTYDDRLRFKGSSLVSRSTERFGRRFVREAVRLLLDEDIQGLHDLYLAYRDRITAHAWDGVEDFARTETLKDTLEQYEADVAAGKRPRAAAYELARRRAETTGQPVRKGDRVTYYIAGTGAHVTGFENARLAGEWDPARPDENTAYYLKRLDEFARKFEPFFTEHDFRLIFSPEDLFGFSPRGIRPLTHERVPDEVEDEIPF